ncbi:MAG: hypothetical protein AAGB22_02610 [Bacteroidota bacterium]
MHHRPRLLLSILLVSALATTACSKCWDCEFAVENLDANGNVISVDTAIEEVCTSNNQDIDEREANGFRCTRR